MTFGERAGAALSGAPDPQAVLTLFEPVLERLGAEAAVHFGTPQVRLSPVSHEDRPFSQLLRVGVWRPGSERPDCHLFVKRFKPKPEEGGVERMRQRVLHDYHVSRRIFDAMAAVPGVGAVRPIACYPDHLTVVTQQADGETLMAHLDRHARWFPASRTMEDLARTMAAVGRWVKVFQSTQPGTRLVDLADWRAYVAIRLDRLAGQGIVPPSFRDRFLSHLDLLAAQVPEADLADVVIHADLAPGNVLVAGDRIVVLDFAMTQRGSAVHDISRLYVQLDVLAAKPQFRSAVVRRLQSALLEGFDPAMTASRPLFRFFVLLHRLNHFGSLSVRQEPFPARALTGRVRRMHRAAIEHEFRDPVTRGHLVLR